MKRRPHGGYPLYPASNHYDPIRRRFFNPEPKRRLQPLDFGGASPRSRCRLPSLILPPSGGRKGYLKTNKRHGLFGSAIPPC